MLLPVSIISTFEVYLACREVIALISQTTTSMVPISTQRKKVCYCAGWKFIMNSTNQVPSIPSNLQPRCKQLRLKDYSISIRIWKTGGILLVSYNHMLAQILPNTSKAWNRNVSLRMNSKQTKRKYLKPYKRSIFKHHSICQTLFNHAVVTWYYS